MHENFVNLVKSVQHAYEGRREDYCLRQPHSGTSSSISDPPIPSPVTSSSSDLPLCTSLTPSLFQSRLKTYLFHKSHPVVSLLPSGLPPRNFAWTVSSELLGFCFYFLIFLFLGGALD